MLRFNSSLNSALVKFNEFSSTGFLILTFFDLFVYWKVISLLDKIFHRISVVSRNEMKSETSQNGNVDHDQIIVRSNKACLSSNESKGDVLCRVSSMKMGNVKPSNQNIQLFIVKMHSRYNPKFYLLGMLIKIKIHVTRIRINLSKSPS